MSFTVHPLFQASSNSVSFSPKATQGSLGSGPETASALFKGTGKSAGTDTKDTVKLSSFAEALSGRAAAAYESLDGRAQEMLGKLVGSGRINAKDAALGLEALATQSAFGRFTSERPQDAEDLARQEQANARTDAIVKGATPSAESEAAYQERRDLLGAFGRGDLDQAEYQKRAFAGLSGMPTAPASGGVRLLASPPSGGDASASANAAFQKNLSLFAESERGANGEAARGPYDKDGAAAIDTLATLGFTKAVYGDAFSRYASTLSFK